MPSIVPDATLYFYSELFLRPGEVKTPFPRLVKEVLTHRWSKPIASHLLGQNGFQNTLRRWCPFYLGVPCALLCRAFSSEHPRQRMIRETLGELRLGQPHQTPLGE